MTDNTALAAAAATGAKVLPVYVLSDWQKTHPWTGLGRQQFLCGSLATLARNLEKIGGRLIIRRGEAVQELGKLIEETGATEIYANRDPDPFGRRTEAALEKMVAERGLGLRLYKDVAMHERDEVLTGQKTIFRVFTPYSKAWLKLEKLVVRPAIAALATPSDVFTLPLPTISDWGLEGQVKTVEPGEDAALARLKTFLGSPIHSYGSGRNFPSQEQTSRLSQDLRWGLLSPRQIYARCAEAAEQSLAPRDRRSIEIYINELIWREFNMQLLWHYPQLLDEGFNPKYTALQWDENKAAYERWEDARTGFPIIDAALRQLHQTGFMHNRLRMIVAMFLTKDLHLHYRKGEQHFSQHLIDGEIASNNGGWQWSAGTGADAAPYFRIQNPWLQAEKFDEQGVFIKKWLPELRDVPVAKFFQPPVGRQPLAKSYPLPMVDHSVERDETLARFKIALEQSRES